METGKTIRGSTKLAFDFAHGVTNIAEGMYRNIAATPLPLGEEPEGRAQGIAGLVHESIRRVIRTTSGTADWILERLAPDLDRTLPAGPHREAIIAALNGVCGDHLANSGNPLAIPMQLRMLLPPLEQSKETADSNCLADEQAPKQEQTKASLFEVEKRSIEIHPQPNALTDDAFNPTGKLLILVHGLSMNEREWTSHQHNHAEALAENSDYTPVYALYNSGRNISTNGRELCDQLTALLSKWPVPVNSISVIGFSMGGLLTRSAMHIAQEEEHPWLAKVDKAVYVGTPHHGAVMERGGYWLQKSLTYSPYSAPLAALGRVRSKGITDLRHGNVQDDDWQHHDEHADNGDVRRPTPLPDDIKHYAIAATLSKVSGDRIGKLLGDGLVHPSSATGRHKQPELQLQFPEGHTKIFYDLGHLAMLRDQRVMRQLEEWLNPEADSEA
ncbi:alpha/beta hydrolase [Halieaceae bacterium IMCC14734]|uniref:Alpha/beta hydrolase n=1 Tax=Candidatus Litorirhabdus singularis TaxID=2518993 RepID=A0ABT3TFG0_9GAMM|nr:alpha/beta fold hydrolase [Candidatus Litorirhabdus singularis]MCX2980555.1 alpha/beta hydrolase [Candidatus Litorirhabdus singularis]